VFFPGPEIYDLLGLIFFGNDCLVLKQQTQHLIQQTKTIKQKQSLPEGPQTRAKINTIIQTKE
jgi:hypothetical protein